MLLIHHWSRWAMDHLFLFVQIIRHSRDWEGRSPAQSSQGKELYRRVLLVAAGHREGAAHCPGLAATGWISSITAVITAARPYWVLPHVGRHTDCSIHFMLLSQHSAAALSSLKSKWGHLIPHSEPPRPPSALGIKSKLLPGLLCSLPLLT